MHLHRPDLYLLHPNRALQASATQKFEGCPLRDVNGVGSVLDPGGQPLAHL